MPLSSRRQTVSARAPLHRSSWDRFADERAGRNRLAEKRATGGTLIAGAEALLDAGAIEVYACATHGLFPGNAFEKISRAASSR